MALLEEIGIYLEFLNPEDRFSYHPPKHWCFVADIVYSDNSLRLKFVAENNPGQRTPAMFYKKISVLMIEMSAATIGAADSG